MKTVVITGAGKGIGFAMVNTFLADKDYKVIATSRNVERLRSINHPDLTIIHGDLLNDYTYIKDEILKTSGSITTLINNAALILNRELLEVTDSDIKEVMEINFSAPYKLIRDLFPAFHRGTHIINISSMSGFQGSKKFNGLTLYSSSKAALASLAECVAEEWKERGIFCNSLALGAVDTEMIKVSIPGMEPKISAAQMAQYIYEFSQKGHQFYNGQVLPVTLSTI
jgi:3-oxoacyl-[acyl-carrier protein] reductase